jgi:hypothetical protein
VSQPRSKNKTACAPFFDQLSPALLGKKELQAGVAAMLSMYRQIALLTFATGIKSLLIS